MYPERPGSHPVERSGRSARADDHRGWQRSDSRGLFGILHRSHPRTHFVVRAFLWGACAGSIRGRARGGIASASRWRGSERALDPSRSRHRLANGGADARRQRHDHLGPRYPRPSTQRFVRSVPVRRELDGADRGRALQSNRISDRFVDDSGGTRTSIARRDGVGERGHKHACGDGRSRYSAVKLRAARETQHRRLIHSPRGHREKEARADVRPLSFVYGCADRRQLRRYTTGVSALGSPATTNVAKNDHRRRDGSPAIDKRRPLRASRWHGRAAHASGLFGRQRTPGDVRGIELYLGAATLPVEFSSVQPDAPCGIVMIWTKSGAER